MFRQAVALRRLGCAVSVLAPGAPGAPERDEFDGIPVTRFRYLPDQAQNIAYGGGIPANLRARPARWLGVPFFAAGLVRAAASLVREHDVIHAHWSFAGALCSLDTVRQTRPLVVSFHGSDLVAAGGPYARFAKRAGTRAAAVVVHSEAMRARAIAAGVNATKILLLPHGVDVASYAPRRDAGQTTRLVAVGRLSIEKGFDLLIDALVAADTTSPWSLEIVGDGPLKADLAERIDRAGLSDRVTLLGALPQSLVRERLCRADALVVPSRREGFNVVALEAMAAGLPIIGTRVGALPSLVDDGRTGVLVPPEQPAALAGELVRLIGKRQELQQMGDAARAVVTARFDLLKVNEPLVEAYRRLTDRT